MQSLLWRNQPEQMQLYCSLRLAKDGTLRHIRHRELLNSAISAISVTVTPKPASSG